MAWKPRVDTRLFTQIGEKLYLLNDGSGTVYNNPLTVQMISDTYKRYEKGIATPQQIADIQTIFGYEEPKQFTAKQAQKRGIPQTPTDFQTGEEFIDYIPPLSDKTSPKDWTYENAYNNFMTEFLDSTNDGIFRTLKKALDSTGMSKVELGKGLMELPYDVLYYLSYSGNGSEEAVAQFASDLVNHIPDLDENTKLDIENQIFDEFF